MGTVQCPVGMSGMSFCHCGPGPSTVPFFSGHLGARMSDTCVGSQSLVEPGDPVSLSS